MKFHDGAEAKGPLGSVPMEISCYLAPSVSISRLDSHFNPLLPPAPPDPTLTPPPMPTLPLPPPSYQPIVKHPPVNITSMPPMFPSTAPPPDTAPISGGSQCTGICYPSGAGCMSSPPI